MKPWRLHSNRFNDSAAAQPTKMLASTNGSIFGLVPPSARLQSYTVQLASQEQLSRFGPHIT